MDSNEHRFVSENIDPWNLGKSMDGLSLDETFIIEELRPRHGYDRSCCPDCKIMVHPFEDRSTPEGRTVPSSQRRVINHPEGRRIVYDPICPGCGMHLPAVIKGGKGA